MIEKVKIGVNILKFESVDSTNNCAIELSGNKKAGDGTVIAANYQTAGRGNSGTQWESENRENLIFSIILDPLFIQPQEQFLLSKAISLGIADFIKLYVDNVAIKWPNDIYVSDKKVGGILIESFIKDGRLDRVIAGIGVNVNQEKFKLGAPNPVSLKNLTGMNFDLDECLDLVLGFIETRYNNMKSYEEKQKIDKDYLENLYKYQVFANFSTSCGTIDAKIIGVDESGKLTLVDKENGIHSYGFKEITFLD